MEIISEMYPWGGAKSINQILTKLIQKTPVAGMDIVKERLPKELSEIVAKMVDYEPSSRPDAITVAKAFREFVFEQK